MSHVSPITVTLADVRHVNNFVLNLGSHVSITAFYLVTLPSGCRSRYLLSCHIFCSVELHVHGS